MLLDDDDMPRGRVLTRKEALALLGGAAVAAFLPQRGRAASTTSCIVRPELTEGPFYVDEQLERSDIRVNPADGAVCDGALLALAFNVSRLTKSGCDPLAGSLVDVWHCDAHGAYSDVKRGGPDGASTLGKKFLRGYQITDKDGAVRFTTIYPGWYPGRAVHIHFKIRSAPGAKNSFDFASQVFFDDLLSDSVFAAAPYTSRGARSTRNADDGIFSDGGRELLLDVKKDGTGYAATFDIAMDIGEA